jgi:hypothetical protein
MATGFYACLHLLIHAIVLGQIFNLSVLWLCGLEVGNYRETYAQRLVKKSTAGVYHLNIRRIYPVQDN